MSGFNYVGAAEIKHLNIRKEGPEAAKALAVDVKFFVSASHLDLSGILGAESERDVVRAIWNEDGSVRFTGIEQIKSWAEFTDHTGRVGGIACRFEKVGKFAITPRGDYAADLTFSITLSEPGDALLRVLTASVSELISLSVEAPLELDLRMRNAS